MILQQPNTKDEWIWEDKVGGWCAAENTNTKEYRIFAESKCVISGGYVVILRERSSSLPLPPGPTIYNLHLRQLISPPPIYKYAYPYKDIMETSGLGGSWANPKFCIRAFSLSEAKLKAPLALERAILHIRDEHTKKYSGLLEMLYELEDKQNLKERVVSNDISNYL